MNDQINIESKGFKRAESNLQGKLKSVFLKAHPHHMVPGYNLNRRSCLDFLTGNSVSDLCQEFPHNCDLPKPLLPPAKLPRAVLNEEDPALHLLSIKSHINDDINRIVHYYQKYQKEFKVIHKKDIKWTENNGQVHTELPRYIAEAAEIYDSDPDPHFSGAYNWYYTGGCLSNLHFNEMDILLFPYMNELIASPIISKAELLWKPILNNATKCELDSTLYELKYNIIGDTCRILGRFKNYCSFYSLSERKGGLSLNEIHRQPSKVPYISADLNPMNNNYYCTLNIDRSVTLWDITKVRHISSNTVQQTTVLEDSWGSLKFQALDPDIILFIDRCCLHYLDIRAPFDKPVLTMCLKTDMESCESISVDTASRNTSCRYVGTYHNLFMCDNRSPNQCVQQRWTHQFKSAPLLACITNRDGNEIVILSSQLSGESTIVLNTWVSNEHAHSYNLPLTPPSIMETLNESQMQGMCLDPIMKNRLGLCNAGSILITNQNRDVFFFLQNSIGDIFYQCITHEDVLNKFSDINCKAVCALDAWEHALLKQSSTIMPLTISERVNMQHIFEKFKDKKLRLKCDESTEISYDPSWKQSLDKLNSYVDILAPELLGVWEVSENIDIPLSAAPHQKVLSWLETASEKNIFTQSQEDSNFITPLTINTQELISVSQEPDITNVDDSNALQELLLPKVKTKSNIKKKRTFRK